MKKIFFALTFLFLYFSIFGQQTGAEYCSMRHQNQKHLYKNQTAEKAITHDYDVLKYWIDVDLYNCFASPYSHFFPATVTIDFKANSAISVLTLDAVNASLKIKSVSGDGTSFTHQNNVLQINLQKTFNAGESGSVKIVYEHLNVTDYAIYVANGFFFTDCEPERARCWFPCWDKPYDKALLDLKARVPVNVKLGSNGQLKDSVLTAQDLVYHWESNNPVSTYLVVMAARTNYNLDIVYWPKKSNPSEKVPMRFYYNPGENPSQAKNIIVPLTDYFSEVFCEHPFEKNGFASLNSEFQWGGMENQTLTTLCGNCWQQSLIVHEFAHQWFGDMITCARWSDIWLNEGFATWSEALWIEKQSGYDAYKASILSNATKYLNSNPGWAISENSWNNSVSDNVLFNYYVTYMKGACAVHLLRYSLGDTKFFEFLKAYTSDLQFKYNAATIDDFRQKLNSVTGENYDWFINDWIYQKNHPSYNNQIQISNPETNKWQVLFNTKQVQTNTGFFRMFLEIKVVFKDNTTVTERVFNNSNNQDFTFNYTKEPVQVIFDPQNQIVLKNATSITTSVNKITNNATDLLITPNPVTNDAEIIWNLKENTFCTIDLFDISGKKLETIYSGNLPSGKQTCKIHTGNLQSGIYIIKQNLNGKTTQMKRFIKN